MSPFNNSETNAARVPVKEFLWRDVACAPPIGGLLVELFSWLQQSFHPPIRPDTMTNTALEAIASSSGKNCLGDVSLGTCWSIGWLSNGPLYPHGLKKYFFQIAVKRLEI